MPPVSSRREAKPETHLKWAERMVQALPLEATSYQHRPIIVTWKGYDGATAYESRADCSGFLNALLMRAYQLTEKDLEAWLDTKRPLAKTYHDAIVDENQFQSIRAIQDVQPGDVIAIEYPPDDPESGPDTGHVLLVADTPRRRDPSAPIMSGTTQWEVSIIDQSRTGHGVKDTRHLPDGGYASGLGKGVMRIYASRLGNVRGHSWSTSASSKFRAQAERHLVVGRLPIG